MEKKTNPCRDQSGKACCNHVSKKQLPHPLDWARLARRTLITIRRGGLVFYPAAICDHHPQRCRQSGGSWEQFNFSFTPWGNVPHKAALSEWNAFTAAPRSVLLPTTCSEAEEAFHSHEEPELRRHAFVYRDRGCQARDFIGFHLEL